MGNLGKHRPKISFIFVFMTNRGLIAANAITKSGQSRGYVAERLRIDRKTLYNRLQKSDLEYDFIFDLYKVLRMDVTEDFPELGRYVLSGENVDVIGEDLDEGPTNNVNNEEVEMWKKRCEECERKVELLEEYHHKYTKLLEEYTLLLKEKKGYS